MWAQSEQCLELRHGWLSASEWDQYLEGWPVMNTKCVPSRLYTLVYWESLSWLTSVGTTRNAVSRVGWSRIGLAVLILQAAGAGLIGRPAVISGHYNKWHSLQLQNHYALSATATHTRSCKTQLCGTGHGKWSWVSRHFMLALAGGICLIG